MHFGVPIAFRVTIGVPIAFWVPIGFGVTIGVPLSFGVPPPISQTTTCRGRTRLGGGAPCDLGTPPRFGMGGEPQMAFGVPPPNFGVSPPQATTTSACAARATSPWGCRPYWCAPSAVTTSPTATRVRTPKMGGGFPKSGGVQGASPHP